MCKNSVGTLLALYWRCVNGRPGRDSSDVLAPRSQLSNVNRTEDREVDFRMRSLLRGSSGTQATSRPCAQNLEQVPDEAYLGLSVASIFTAMGLYLSGHRGDGLVVGLLGTALSTTALPLRLLATGRTQHHGSRR